MKIAIINGPNLNLLGTREPEVYGSTTFEQYFQQLQQQYPQVSFTYFQSNIEGELVTALQEAGTAADAIVLNPAAYTHTSVAIGDAIAAIQPPVVEVHISNVHARESFRQVNYVSAKVVGTITGLGLRGNQLAVEYLVNRI